MPRVNEMKQFLSIVSEKLERIQSQLGYKETVEFIQSLDKDSILRQECETAVKYDKILKDVKLRMIRHAMMPQCSF